MKMAGNLVLIQTVCRTMNVTLLAIITGMALKFMQVTQLILQTFRQIPIVD